METTIANYSEAELRNSEVGFLLGLALIMLALITIFYLTVPFLAKLATGGNIPNDNSNFHSESLYS